MTTLIFKENNRVAYIGNCYDLKDATGTISSSRRTPTGRVPVRWDRARSTSTVKPEHLRLIREDDTDANA